MLKSLFAGVSGLQSHQIAMDVESNNIANVNTIGFKYSRANFSDLLAQTQAIATAPQGELGGKNPVQVGLGSTVSSMTRIFSQGSIQNSDKNTDVAIQGDGFFIISPDGGNTYKYSRSGDFKFDAGGNFVDNNGFIVQGWLRDRATGFVDATAPITNINIPPGLTTPASPTQNVVIKANLNSGPLVKTYSPEYEVKSYPTGTVLPILQSVDENGNPIDSGDMGVMFNDSGEAFNLQAGQGIWASFIPTNTTATGIVAAGGGPGLPAELDITFELDNGTQKQINTSGGTGLETQAENAARYVSAINAQTSVTGITATYDPIAGQITLTNGNSDTNASHNVRIFAVGNANSGFVVGDSAATAYRYQYDPTGAVTVAGGDKKFTSIADLREALENQARAVGDGDLDGVFNENNIEIIVNSQGKFELSNPGGSQDGDYDINLAITGMSANSIVGGGISENTRFTRNMEALNATLPAGSTGKAFSQSFNAATHSASIDIFDSLGSKHTLRTQFRKVAVDASTGSTWNMKISVPEPATIDSVAPYNEKTGFVRFNSDGSLATYNPPNVSFTANNGSAANQQVAIKLGTSNSFDGMTSFDSPSSTSGISQDGFTGGDLVGIRIDQSGTLVGSFSNGRSFGLAQIAMAKFTNNEGLSTEGGNVYIQTANSGDPIIGTAATAGRGFMQSAALEASNVDLSRALTQLIIIQRGYQANGKTITTSDQLLQTLIGLKQ
ncbi:flagellar hook protein FlgE [Sulfurimonas sp.]|uniref:flagellar hook protein FlgE n=1 Tax=Sulfurimonas sp. TaxID=2022749 RepID=UPI0025EE8D6E|nr:flagellar hook protein FlgE [Sulfurimonas sp.]MBW6488381.1 flagellar hook protein FlgE [Sulfurimonas sp.]